MEKDKRNKIIKLIGLPIITLGFCGLLLLGVAEILKNGLPLVNVHTTTPKVKTTINKVNNPTLKDGA